MIFVVFGVFVAAFDEANRSGMIGQTSKGFLSRMTLRLLSQAKYTIYSWSYDYLGSDHHNYTLTIVAKT